MITLLTGDNLPHLRALPEASVDACVTDPPYGLSFMGKAWDYDVPGVETWREVLRVLKPGGHLLSFFGTRTYHRGVVAIEDAGFEIRDQLQWIYGSGFPKSHNLDGAHEGWGTALKPAHEPIVLARKPLAGTVAENVAAHGTGALNVDGCRVEGSATIRHNNGGTGNPENWRTGNGHAFTSGSTAGRWPANVLHDGSAEVLELFPQTTSNSGNLTHRNGKQGVCYGERKGCLTSGITDTGSAARFFYCAKASRADRNEGLDHLPKRPLHWSSGSQNPGSFQSEGTDKSARNPHPTVKPTALMRWLVRLITPPGGLVLDPFMGSGSTGKACALEGFAFLGIEREPDYLEIARARIAAARPEPASISTPKPRARAPRLTPVGPEQFTLFQGAA